MNGYKKMWCEMKKQSGLTKKGSEKKNEWWGKEVSVIILPNLD